MPPLQPSTPADPAVPAVAAVVPGTPAPAPAPAALRSRRLRTFESLSDRNFRWFFGSMFGGFSAISMQQLAASWLAFELTDSFAALGAFFLASGLSSLALSLPGGVLADKVRDPKRFIQMGQIAGAVIGLVMGLIIASGNVGLVHVLVGGALMSGAHALTMPARQALAPAVVGMERLTNALALYTSGQNAAFLLSPALAGWVIGTLGSDGDVDGAQYVYYLLAAIYVAAALLLLPVHVARREPPVEARRPLADLADGARYVMNQPTMRALLGFNALVALFWGTYMSLLPGFAKDVLDADALHLGLILSIGGLGAVIGSLAIASMQPRRRGLLWLLSVLLLGIAQFAFATSSLYGLSVSIALVIGLGQAGYLSLGTVLLQAYVDEAYRGRVLSVYLLQFGFMSLGTFGISVLANALGVQLAVGTAGLCLVVAATAALLSRSRLARLD